jgi:O-antigen/teichoic acid export membrane protein
MSSAKIDSAVVASRGVSYLTIQTVVTSLVQIVSFAILTRIITPAEVGILAILSLVLALSQSINGTAFQQSATKFIGESDDKKVASAVFYQTLRISAVIAVPVGITIFLLAPWLALTTLGQVTKSYLFRALAVDLLVSSGALPVAIGALYGLKRFKIASAIGIAGIVIRQALIILFIILLKDFVGLVYAWILSDTAMFVACTAYAFRIAGVQETTFPIGKLLNFSWPLTISSIISFGSSWFDRALLVLFVPLAALGIYNAALTAFAVLNYITIAIGNVLLPVYAGMSGRNRLEGCRRATYLASRYVSLTMTPLAFGLLATARPALTLFVGRAYLSGTEPLMILCCFFALTLFGTALGPMLLALEETRLSSLITIVSIVAGLASAALLLPISGIIGASIARSLVLVTTTALTLIVLHRQNAMKLDVQAIWKSLLAGGVMTGTLLFIQLIVYNSILLPIYILAGCVIYLIALRLLKAVRREDVDLIGRYLGPRLNICSRVFSAIVLPD